MSKRNATMRLTVSTTITPYDGPAITTQSFITTNDDDTREGMLADYAALARRTLSEALDLLEE